MTQNQNQVEQEIDRRAFIKALALTGVAATAAGGGTALWLNRTEGATVIEALTPPPPVAAPTVARATATANSDVPDLLARLAASEAEKLRLQADLDAAQRRLAALEENSGDVAQANETLQFELASANNRVSLLAGLVALYEQLDALDLSDTIDSGLHNFGTAIGDLVEDLPSFEEGVTRGVQALDDLEAQIPLMQSGRQWLLAHLGRLGPLYAQTESVLDAAVDTAGDFLHLLNTWFQGLLKWLPFGVGDRAAAVMAALTELLDETPNTIQGLQRNVAEPMDLWLKGEGEEVPLRQHLVKPLKEDALQPAGEIAGRVRAQKQLYETTVVEPAKVAQKSRQLVREQVEAYRKKYQI